MRGRIYEENLLYFISSTWADSSRYASQSVLNTGKCVKIRVQEDGGYKLTASELKKMGFSDLSKVAIYGYGGWLLDEDFSSPYIDACIPNGGGVARGCDVDINLHR